MLRLRAAQMGHNYCFPKRESQKIREYTIEEPQLNNSE
jgi:hypothetical protein